MGVALLALFSALGQAPVAPSATSDEARRAAVDAGLRLCVLQAAEVLIGHPLSPEEEARLGGPTDLRTYIEGFRVLDEGEGGGSRFASVEADVSLARVARRLAPAAEVVTTRLAHETTGAAEVRGTGRFAASVRAHGEVLLGGRTVGTVDEIAWGFGASADEAVRDGERRAEDRARAAAQRVAAPAVAGRPAPIGVSLRGIDRPARAIAFLSALPSRVRGVLGARLLRAGDGGVDALIETTLGTADLARALEELDILGRALVADPTPAGDLVVRAVAP
jgi:hypothetical protein